MAERENPADHNANRREAMYKDDKKPAKGQKVEAKATKDAGGKDGKSPHQDTHERHKRERGETHERHSKERDDMHKRQSGEHDDMAKRHDEEVEQAMAAASSPNSAGPQEAAAGAAGANTPAGNVAA